MEMESDLKSAESNCTSTSTSKLQQVFSNFWQLISMTKYTQVEEDEKGEHENEEENQSSSSRIFSPSVKNYSSKSSQTTPESESESSEIPEMVTKDMLEKGTLNSNSNLLPNLTSTTSTLDSFETNKSADQLLRMISRETQEEFYKLFECLKCQRQFNNLANGRRHVKIVHFQLGISCSFCKQKYFTKESLELHILKCSKRAKKITASLNNGRRKPVKVHLRPHDEQKQGQTPDSPQNPTKKIKVQDEHAQNSRKVLLLNPLEIKVRNPFQNFDIEKTLNAKVVIKRLRKNQKKEKGQQKKAPKNPTGKTQAQDETVQSPRKVVISDTLKIKVRNPLANFSLENAMNVKVVIKRVNIKNRKKPVSIISQVETETGKSVERSCSSSDQNQESPK